MGLLKPESGVINVGGIENPSVEQTAGNLGYVFQNPDNHLFAETVKEEVEFILKNTKRKGSVDKILKVFGIIHYKDSYPRYLSGGEKQRVALASILVAQPKALLLDEPTRGMDHTLKKKLAGYLLHYIKQGNLVIMATHDGFMASCATRRIKL
jgi:energy-coupling factor transport system ATP-binding protein